MICFQSAIYEICELEFFFKVTYQIRMKEILRAMKLHPANAMEVITSKSLGLDIGPRAQGTRKHVFIL